MSVNSNLLSTDQSTFESGTVPTGYVGGGSPLGVVSVTSERSHSGTYSLKYAWPSAGDWLMLQGPDIFGFVTGERYLVSSWVYQPAGSPFVALSIAGVVIGESNATYGSWVQLKTIFNATQDNHRLQWWSSTGTPGSNTSLYVDDIEIIKLDNPDSTFGGGAFGGIGFGGIPIYGDLENPNLSTETTGIRDTQYPYALDYYQGNNQTYTESDGLTDSGAAIDRTGYYIETAGLTDATGEDWPQDSGISATKNATNALYVTLWDDANLDSSGLTLNYTIRNVTNIDSAGLVDSLTRSLVKGITDSAGMVDIVLTNFDDDIGWNRGLQEASGLTDYDISIDIREDITDALGLTDSDLTPNKTQNYTALSRTDSTNTVVGLSTESASLAIGVVASDSGVFGLSTESASVVKTDATLFTLINNHVVTASPQVYGEWNLNRYSTATVTNNSEPAASAVLATSMNYNKYFPIDSIVRPNRYGNKVCYPVLNQAYRDNNITNLGYYSYAAMTYERRETIPARTYIASGDAPYQYWVSSPYSRSLANGSISNVNPMAEYATAFKMNKILVRFNVHAYRPSTVSIEYRYNSSWTSTGAAWSVPANGLVEIYRATGGTWSTTPTYWTESADNTISVDGIRLSVSTMTGPGAQVELVEMSPRFVADLSSVTVSYDVNNEVSEKSYIAPVGVASANTGNIVFSNNTGLFDKDNSSSILYGLMDDGIVFTVNVAYGANVVRQMTMLSDKWEVEGWETATVNLIDDAKILQKTKLPDLLLENYRAANIIWTLCDMVGFTNTIVYESAANPSDVVEFFWAGKDQTVWEVIQELASAYQLAVFFDEYRNLRIMTRDYLMDNTRGVKWTFMGQDSTTLSDIISFNPEQVENINKVVVKYKATNSYHMDKSDEKTKSKNEIFWEAPSDWGVGAAQVALPISNGATYITIRNTEDLPRFAGKLQIGSSILEYISKGYIVNGQERQVKNETDYLLAVEDNNGVTPTFSGKVYLKNPITFDWANALTRFAADFMLIDMTDGATTSISAISKFTKDPVTGIRVNALGNTAQKRTGGIKNFATSFDRAGVKFKLTSTTGSFGVFLWPQGTASHSGYHFTVQNGDDPTKAGTNVFLRGVRVENDGTPTQLTNLAAVSSPILKTNAWYALEVIVAPISGGWAFNVYLNGKFIGTFRDTVGELTRNTRAGFFTCGPTSAVVEQFWAIDFPTDAKKIPDGLKTYYPDDAWREAKTDLPLNYPDIENYYADRAIAIYLAAIFAGGVVLTYTILDYGGSYIGVVREIFEETVRFDDIPIRKLEFLNTNPFAQVISWRYTPMGAKFSVRNNSNIYQQLNGTWETDVSGATRDESFLIYGEGIFFSPEQSVENTDQALAKRRGESSVEFSSDWVQTRSSAQRLADWVKNRFGKDSEEYNIEAFGNPFLSVGDLVSINYTTKGLTGSNFYGVVTSLNNSWDDGLWTNVSVRRIVNV